MVVAVRPIHAIQPLSSGITMLELANSGGLEQTHMRHIHHTVQKAPMQHHQQ
jgi:hypothetical protein